MNVAELLDELRIIAHVEIVVAFLPEMPAPSINRRADMDVLLHVLGSAKKCRGPSARKGARLRMTALESTASALRG